MYIRHKRFHSKDYYKELKRNFIKIQLLIPKEDIVCKVKTDSTAKKNR